MKIPAHYSALCAALLGALNLAAQTNVGQWDFTNGDLSATIGGTPLLYGNGTTQSGTSFGTTTQLGIPDINGVAAKVMAYPASSLSGGFQLPTTGLTANGGGEFANDYTIVIDVLFPTVAAGHVRPLVQTDDGILTPNADLVVDSAGGIGAPNGPYHGVILPNVWYRIAFAISGGVIDEFINGIEVGTQPTDGTDGRFALYPPGATDSDGPPLPNYALLFENSTLNGAAPGYVSSIQLWNDALSPGQIAALGAPAASKIPISIGSIPSYVTAKFPSPNGNDSAPNATVSGILYPGGATIDPNSLSIMLDGVALTANITNTGSNFIFSATAPGLLPPFSQHVAAIAYTDSVAGRTTNAWPFSVFGYQSISLPAPVYFENFDELTEGSLPPGWTVTNWTDTGRAGLDLDDPKSDSYKDWVTVSQPRYSIAYPDTDDYTSPGFPHITGNRRQMLPPIYENGSLVTNLCSGNVIVAESDQRSGNQVQALFTRDYDFTGQSNIYLSFHHMNEQNQDNMCAVEYSVDKGTNWLPLLYMFDDGTTDTSGSDVVTNQATGQIDVYATFNTARNDQAHQLSFGSFIGAPVTPALAPYVRPCRNDDPIQQKRIEFFGLPAAANSPNVRLRFMQAGTGSWFFDIDDLGFYSIQAPRLLFPLIPTVADFNGPAVFNAQVGGPNVSYFWFYNGNNIAGANAATYTIPHVASNDIGLYSFVASNSYGAITSDPIPLTLFFTPIILSSPQELNLAPGDAASFIVDARGGQPLSYQWLFNSNAIPGATNLSYSVASVDATNVGLYQVQVSNSFSTVVSTPAPLAVYSGPITSNLVVHLTFDGTYADSSGRGNDAAPVGSPAFAPGILGLAVRTTTSGTPQDDPATNNYVTLGRPNDLNFGADFTGNSSDFSVSFWTKIFSQHDDESFIGNKDWGSGSNPGWIINSEGDGMKWNYRDDAVNASGVGSARRDAGDVAPQLEDGGWHHVVVTFARHSVGKTYVDGVLVSTQPLAPDAGKIGGSIDPRDAGLPYSVNIGQDGAGHYTDGSGAAAIDMLMDDVAIWRRVLNSHEALEIFNAGLNGNSVELAATATAGVKPVIQVQPLDAFVAAGSNVKLYAGALGSPTLTYQWYLGGGAIADATNNAYTIANIQAAAPYSVIVSNSYGAATSRVAQITLGSVLAPTISAGHFSLSWSAAVGLELESTATLSPPSWTPVPGTLGAGSVSIPLTNSEFYFRLVKVQ